MEREDLLSRIMVEVRSMTLAYYAYMHTDREYVKDYNLYLRELHFLLAVGGSESLSMTEIANHLEVTQGAATQIASRLLRKDLIAKVKNRFDKRYTVIMLTEQGKHVYAEYSRVDAIRRKEVFARMDIFAMSDLDAILKYAVLMKELCADFQSRTAPEQQ